MTKVENMPTTGAAAARSHSLRFTILPYPATSQGLRTISDPNDTTLPACLTGEVKRHIYTKSKSGTRQRWQLEIVYSVRRQKNTSTLTPVDPHC